MIKDVSMATYYSYFHRKSKPEPLRIKHKTFYVGERCVTSDTAICCQSASCFSISRKDKPAFRSKWLERHLNAT